MSLRFFELLLGRLAAGVKQLNSAMLEPEIGGHFVTIEFVAAGQMRSFTAVQNSIMARGRSRLRAVACRQRRASAARLRPHSNGRTTRLLSRDVIRVSQSCIQRR